MRCPVGNAFCYCQVWELCWASGNFLDLVYKVIFSASLSSSLILLELQLMCVKSFSCGYAGPGVVNVDRRQPGVRGHHSRVCGAGRVAAAVDGAVHNRRALAPEERSLHVPLLWQRECFCHL